MGEWSIAMSSNKVLEERKKRTLVALERRFAQEKAEHVIQQQKSQKRLRVEPNRTARDSKRPSQDASTTPSTHIPFKKGNITFSGFTQKEEGSESAYIQLTHGIHENLLRDDAEASKKLSTVDHFLHDLFQHGDSAEKYMQGSKSIKIDNWILLDNFVQKNGTLASARSRALQAHSRRSKRHMSLKQLKKAGVLCLPKELHYFELFKPMQERWNSYITQLLKHVGKNQLAQCLLNADLHGSVILVVQCKISAFCGVRGIMIRETAETFGIVTEDDKFRVVPKKLSVFMLQVDCWKITLLGDKLTSRSQIRQSQSSERSISSDWTNAIGYNFRNKIRQSQSSERSISSDWTNAIGNVVKWKKVTVSRLQLF